MPFPVSYFDDDGLLIEGAAGSTAMFDGLGDAASAELAKWIKSLHAHGFAISRVCDPYPGQVARVQIDAYGESAAEVEATLLEYAERAGAGLQSRECSYGRCVIERNLEEAWGETYSWRGRLTLNPSIGSIESSQRATAALNS